MLSQQVISQYGIFRKLPIKSRYLNKLINYLTIQDETALLIGGAVRDALLGLGNKDLDIATSHEPEQVINILTSHQVKVIPTGLKYGTVTALLGNEKFEITTLRRDLACDGRYAKVAFAKNYQEDAARRDFTINALSYCPLKNILFDYFNGIEHLANQQVIFIGKAEKRISEDFLRILRFFRFSANYAKQIDEEGLAACQQLRFGLKNLSKERIKAEFDLILTSSRADIILNIMFKTGILAELLPIEEYDLVHHQKLTLLAKELGLTKLNISIYYALLLAKSKSLNYFLTYFFSKKERKEISLFLELTQLTTKEQLLKLKELWLDSKNYEYSNFLEYSIFAATFSHEPEIILEFAKNLINKIPPIFPLTGQDLLNIGYSGKILGDKLASLKQAWLLSDYRLSKNELIIIAKKQD